MEQLTGFFTILMLIVAFIAYNLILIVPMRELCVIERLGKFRSTLEPGLHFLIPFVDRVAYRHETRELCINIPHQSCISRDNIQIDVDALLYIKVMDAYKASYGIEDYLIAAINLAQTTVRSEVGKLRLSQTFSERDALNETIVREIDNASEPWGIKVMRYEVMNITPSRNVIDVLEKQMEAERQKRAEITLANAERDSTINLSEGERQEAINLSEGERQKRINEANGRAQEISILATATANGMTAIARAIKQPGGYQAMNVRLVESYIDQVDSLYARSDVSIVPSELANIEGMFEGFDRVATTINRTNRKGS
ncbi:MAG: SPFH domain-containing protein [Pseudomonadales bacterium]|jgi:regulator of protease activity HflC (stomatin/prohibitin superfamily)|nr:SPFH domain-containing protein [Pseudomonadales bacterium]MDC3358665.1 paraslipin [Pseudomonadales bacterium]MDG1000569.1 SPFH domain-containing protein [Pseudomonadales bacterium]MDG1303718.1 SPFH domain-containing protein [Pseudomonadales bacterium]MDG1910554.1 SPFH domain-containing protein [Pseudomonadales bacterium]